MSIIGRRFKVSSVDTSYLMNLPHFVCFSGLGGLSFQLGRWVGRWVGRVKASDTKRLGELGELGGPPCIFE